jgi:hypothetical protein
MAATEGVFNLAKEPVDLLTAGGVAKLDASSIVAAAGTKSDGSSPIRRWGTSTVTVKLRPGIAG